MFYKHLKLIIVPLIVFFVFYLPFMGCDGDSINTSIVKSLDDKSIVQANIEENSYHIDENGSSEKLEEVSKGTMEIHLPSQEDIILQRRGSLCSLPVQNDDMFTEFNNEGDFQHVNNEQKLLCYYLPCCFCISGGLVGLLVYLLTHGSDAGGDINICHNKCFSDDEKKKVVEMLAKNKIVENVDFSFCPKDHEDFYVFNLSRNINSDDIAQYYRKSLYSTNGVDFSKDFDGLTCSIGVKDPQKFFSNDIVRQWLGMNISGLECVKAGTVKQTDLTGLFKDYSSLKYVDLLKINFSSVSTMEDMFYGCSNLTTILVNWQNTSGCRDMSGLFYNCSSLREVDFFIKTVDVTNVKKMDYLFGGCSKIENIDCGSWKLKSIISMSHFFDNCRNLKSVSLPQLGDSIENISFMFSDCKKLFEIHGLGNFNPINIKNMKSMFYGCSVLTDINLSSFTGNKTENIDEIFAYCNSLTTIDAPFFSLNNVKNYDKCFAGDTRLTRVCAIYNEKFSSLLANLWDQKNPSYVNGCYNNYLNQCSLSDLKSELEEKFDSLGLVENKDFFWSDLSHEEGVMVLNLNQSCYLSVKQLYANNQSVFSGIDNLEHVVFVKDNTKCIDTFRQLFKNCKNLKSVDFKGLSTHYVTDMNEMFSGCSSLKNIASLSSLKLSRTTILSGMFMNCNSLETLDGIKYWDLSHVTDMSRMFENCVSLRNISFLEKWNVSNVQNMNRLFYNCSNIQTVEYIKKWDTRSLTNIVQLFYKCVALSEITLDWFTKNITDMSALFYGCTNLSRVTINELDINPACRYDNIFYGCSKIDKVCTPELTMIKNALQNLWSQAPIYKTNCYLKSSEFMCKYSDTKEELNNNMKSLGLTENIDYYWYDKTGETEFFVFQINDEDCYLSCKRLFVSGTSIFNSLLKLHTLKIIQDNKDKVTTAESMFEDCRNLVSVNLKGLDYQNAVSVKSMFRNCNSLTSLDLGAFNTENVESFESMLEGCENIKWVSFDKVITKKSKSFKNMFKGCRLLTSINLSLFDTRLAEDMSGMFDYCESITSLNLASFITPNLKDMHSMFKDCTSLQQISWTNTFNTSSVTNMEYLFYNCNSLIYVVLNFFNTTKVKSFGAMFTNCQSLSSIDVSSLDTSNAVNMSFMFYGCHSLTRLSITHFKVNKVTTMAYMFAGCSSLSDLHLWHNSNTDNLIDMQYMFFGCGSLQKIDLTYITTKKVTNMDYAFYACIRLPVLKLVNFDSTALKTANYMFANCYSLLDIIANSKFSPALYVSTANMFYRSVSLRKVCMVLNSNMLSELKAVIGHVCKSDGCYIKKSNSFSLRQKNPISVFYSGQLQRHIRDFSPYMQQSKGLWTHQNITTLGLK